MWHGNTDRTAYFYRSAASPHGIEAPESQDFLRPLPAPKRFVDEIWFGITRGVGACFWGTHAPILRGGASASPNFWDLLRARTQYEKQQPNFASDVNKTE